MKNNRPFVLYLSAQALLGALWWASLFIWPDTRAWYWPKATSDRILIVFFLPDAIFFVGGSALSAWLVAKTSPARSAVLWLTTGGVGYAALFCLSLWLSTNEAGLAAATMVPAALLTLAVARACA